MNFAGAVKDPIQNTLICTQTDVPWIRSEPVTWRQRPAASITHDWWVYVYYYSGG